jgi:UDP-N-acetylmuramate--alanine ligase
MDLKNIKKVYVIGIKGSGVVGIVEILRVRGIEITGSDTEEKFFTDEILKRLGIRYHESFNEKNIPDDTGLVIYSTAYNENNNIEFRYAKEEGIPMISYPEILAGLFNEKYGLAVCGTHGKTTTSSWLANTLKEVGMDPSAMIGSKVVNWGGNALSGKGEYCVLEADEYQNKLSLYNPKVAILTSCDFDHPDYFKDFGEYKNTFKEFVARIPKAGFLVVWGDSVDTLEVAKSCGAEVLSYGFSEECDYRIRQVRVCNLNLVVNDLNEVRDNPIDSKLSETGFKPVPASNEKISNPKQSFEILYKEKSLGSFEIQLVGRHNILNATAVVAVCHKLQLDAEKVCQALKNFRGTSRRFEYIGERNGAILIDDYGHHPQEIQATLKGAREIFPDKNIWAVFHPHTFTRTKALLSEFSQSFENADKVIVLDIYGSAREIQGGVHSTELVNLINKYDRSKADYIATIDEVVEFLKDKIGSDDVVIAIGAGNGWEVVEKLKIS